MLGLDVGGENNDSDTIDSVNSAAKMMEVAPPVTRKQQRSQPPVHKIKQQMNNTCLLQNTTF